MLTIKELVPSTKVIHYWKHSPSSQHRNKNIFRNTAHYEGLFGISSAWNCFEAGHGKGPCDGIGSTTEHLADDVVKQRKFLLQDADDFYSWAKETQTAISYAFVFVEVQACPDLLRELSVTIVEGTMKLLYYA